MNLNVQDSGADTSFRQVVNETENLKIIGLKQYFPNFFY